MLAAQLQVVAETLVAVDHLWRPIVRHDPAERWYARLHHDDDVEIWLLGWEAGQDIQIHDHGGSSGAFVVAAGALVEHHTARGRRGPLRRRVHGPGEGAAFGPSYVHDLGNAGPGVATSIHVYSPPLTTLTYYDLVDGVPVALTKTIDQVLQAARARLTRVGPAAGAAELAAGALLVDIRPSEQRHVEGEVPGAVVIERNVLEWRLDPVSPHRIPQAIGYDLRVIVMCSEGYTSSLAAAALQDLGLRHATDLDGGFQAWKAAGLPTLQTV